MFFMNIFFFVTDRATAQSVNRWPLIAEARAVSQDNSRATFGGHVVLEPAFLSLLQYFLAIIFPPMFRIH